MTLGDLLQELRNNILRDASSIVAGASDSLWTDEALLRYINEAYQLFSRRTLLLVDQSTPAVTRLLLQDGVAQYPLDASILAVLSARVDGAPEDMTLTGHGLLDAHPRVDASYVWQPIAMNSPVAPGFPVMYSTDESVRVFRVSPTPTAAHTGVGVSLRVARLPLTMFSLDRLGDAPEFPEEYHLAMLDWAAYRALSNHDADAEAANRAVLRKQQFEETIRIVLRDMRRKRFAPAAWLFGSRWDKM